MNKVLEVKCPSCNNQFTYYQSAFRPFCSERCKMVDLGHWLEESYRVPLKENIAMEEPDMELIPENYPIEDGDNE